MTIESILLMLVASFLASLGQFFYKKGLRNKFDPSVIFSPARLFAVMNKRIIMGGLAYFVALVFYLMALSKTPLLLAYPLFAISFVSTLIISKTILHEDVSIMRWIGVAIVITSVSVMAIR